MNWEFKMNYKVWIGALILVFLTHCAFSQNKNEIDSPLAAYKTGEDWHFINSEGKEIFPPQKLPDVGGYSEGFYRVKKEIDGKGKVAFLNQKGEVAIVPDCDKAMDFSDGMAVIMKYTSDAHDDVKCGYINKDGKEVTPCNFNDASDFVRGIAYVLDNDKRGYIDRTGSYVLILQNVVGTQFHEGLAAVTNHRYKTGFINKNGDVVIDYQFDEAGFFSEGLCAVELDGKFGYVNIKGIKVIDYVLDYTHPFKEDRAVVGKLDNSFKIHWGFIDKSGKATVNSLFDEAGDFSEGMSVVKKDKKWGFVNKSGEFVIENKFGSADSFRNGLAWASTADGNEFGFIDSTGKFKVKIQKPDIVVDLRLNKVVYSAN
jgi:hypothetical protein